MTDDIFAAACRDLPEGWHIQIFLESGGSCACLRGPADYCPELGNGHLPLADQVRAAVAYAQQEAVKK